MLRQNPFRKKRIESDDLTSVAIALLSDREIELMSRQDLLDTVRIARSVCPTGQTKQLTDLDDEQLRRVTHLLRRNLRNQLNLISATKGWDRFFTEQL